MKFMFKEISQEENYGKIVDTYAFCQDVKLTTGSRGNKYATITLSDASGIIYAKEWFESFTGDESNLVGKVVRVMFKIQLYDGMPTCIISVIQEADESQYELSDIADGISDEQKKCYVNRLQQYIAAVKNETLKTVLCTVFNENVIEEFCRLPAGLKHHHNFNGALLVHTLEVCDIASFYYKTHQTYGEAKKYSRPINLDILITGSLLHDIGKLKEYQSFPAAERLAEGKLIGHLTSGVIYLTQAYAEAGLVCDEMFYELSHIIMSSHGDSGDIKPMTLEAIIISQADNMSAQADGYCCFCEEDNQKHTGNDLFGYSSIKAQYFLKR